MTREQTDGTDVLFLCVANSARSQMAEGWGHALLANRTVHSAGSEPGRLNPLAVRVMAEVGIDIANQRAKGFDEVPSERIGSVITLCAEEVCPVFPGEVERHHWPHDDPAGELGEVGDEDAQLALFRRVRDEIGERIRRWLAEPGHAQST